MNHLLRAKPVLGADKIAQAGSLYLIPDHVYFVIEDLEEHLIVLGFFMERGQEKRRTVLVEKRLFEVAKAHQHLEVEALSEEEGLVKGNKYQVPFEFKTEYVVVGKFERETVTGACIRKKELFR